QTAIVPGALRRSWTEAGRRYVQYGTDVPTAFGGSVFSARYAVREDRWHAPGSSPGQAVPLRIFHHPGHPYDLDRMVAGMKASLDYYTRTFGPYQFRSLAIVEVPPYGT